MSDDGQLHEAIKIIREMRPIIDPDEDFLAIVAAEEKIGVSEARRGKEREDIYANMKVLSRVLESAKASSTRPSSVPSAAERAEQLNSLDNTHLGLAKTIGDAERLLFEREAELVALKDEERRLESWEPAADHEREMDGAALRLNFFTKLGFEPLLGKDGSTEKMLIRSRTGDIHILDFTTGLSEVEYSQMLWKLAASPDAGE